MTNEELNAKVATLEQREKSNTHRIDAIEQRQENIESLVTSVAVLAQEQEHIKTDVQEIKSDVKAMAERPAKRWDALVGVLISTVVGGVLGYIISLVLH